VLVTILIFAAVGTALVAAPALIEQVRERTTLPDQYEMRRYILSRLSDEQLRQLDAAAQTEFVRMEQGRIEAEKKEREERDRQWEACRDPAVRIRTGCPRQIFTDGWMMQFSSATEVLDEMIMGGCQFARSLYEARLHQCLPPNVGAETQARP
jgi:hypothetical protein